MVVTFDFISGVNLPSELAESPMWEDLEVAECGA